MSLWVFTVFYHGRNNDTLIPEKDKSSNDSVKSRFSSGIAQNLSTGGNYSKIGLLNNL